MLKQINSIAVLLTCHNRKLQTLKCIKCLYYSKEAKVSSLTMDVYVTDDGSTDGTSAEVAELYPHINILKGNGSLFWAGGMRNSWQEALQKDYDAFMLLNDDTYMEECCFDQLFQAYEYSINTYGKSGVIIGSVRDPVTLEYTYGGSIVVNKWTYKLKKVIPDGTIQTCHLGCANIMLVCKSVVDQIGILSDKYIHAKADFDYTLRSNEIGIPVLVCADYCGFCEKDHSPVDLRKLSFKERVQYLKSPKGIELSGYMYYMKRFFPVRAPFVYCSLWLKTIFPSFFVWLNKLLK